VVLALLAATLCGATDTPSGKPFDAPLARTPLAPPLNITGGFCEFRVGHFHAGLDFGTGQRVGQRVSAPADGWIERVRSSGVGYGRSLYLHTRDGRLLQLGHLDAFVEPIASYVRARQDSSGQYEQDLWPEPSRFRFKAGQQIAWSGESGAGGPHLHFEVRRGDMAYHPLRAGLRVTDTTAPVLAALTLEPLDDTSFVAGAPTPATIRLGAEPETVGVHGRVRAIVAARDGVWRGVDRMVPWSVAIQWKGERVECRFDSVSWATDMAEGDYLYDAGRVIGEKGLVLWAPPGFRPRMLLTDAPRAGEVGTIRVRTGDAPARLEMVALDVAGNRSSRTVVLRPASRVAPGAPAGGDARSPRLDLAALPGGWLRVTDRGAPAGSREVDIEATSLGRRFVATPGAAGWTAILPLGVGRRGAWIEELAIRGRDRSGAPWVLSQIAAAAGVVPGESSRVEHSGRIANFPAGASFEPIVVLFFPSGLAAPTRELVPQGVTFTLAPGTTPLRRAARVVFPLEERAVPDQGVYREGDDGWEWVGAVHDSLRGTIECETRRLGRFSVFRDTLAPRVSLQPVPRHAVRGAYNRWAVEARVTEQGSGLDGRASFLEIDGRRVPTEWDAEQGTLRWRPARPPAAGRHRVTIVGADRAGNAARVAGSFVLD